MKKTLTAAAIALAIGGSAIGSAEANTTGLSGIWTGTYVFNMYSPGGGFVGTSGAPQAWTFDFDAGSVSITNTSAFYGSVWTAHDISITDNGTNYGPPPSPNMLFDWSVNSNIPVNEVWDVTATGKTAVVTALSGLILSNSPAFPGFQPKFSGTLSQVPVPAAVWLFGSGLLGLVGVARRKLA